MEPAQPQPLAPGKCEQCRKPLEADRFALWYDHAKNRRSCEHLVCGTCRGMMASWRSQTCPNSKCKKCFSDVQDSLGPGTASTQNFFKFVNYTETGRITKEELADWYTTNFSMTLEDAMNAINSNWQLWDVPKSHSFLKLGWLRSKDQGNLDIDEFAPVQEFMKQSLARSLALKEGALAAAAIVPSASAQPASTDSIASSSHGSQSLGQKRSHAEADTLTEGVLRNVARRKLTQSEELQSKLSNSIDKGRAWFEHFDRDRSGELEKVELTNALLQTFMGSHKVAQEQITSIVDGIWDAIDTDGSGSVNFDEFQMLREAIVEQLRHEKVANAVSRISQAA